MLFVLCLKIPSITQKLDYNGSLNGLFWKLKQKYSPIENSGIFQLSASSIHPNWNPENVLYDDEKGFATNILGSNQYLEFNFLENFIFLHSYTIKSRTDCCQTKSWKVNASINGINWITIHEVIEDISMCSVGKKKTFFINNITNFKFIRFVSTTSRCGDTDLFNILALDFFGSINEISSNSKYSNSFILIFFSYIFFFI